MAKTFEVGGVTYGPEEVLKLREELGLIRAEAMDRADFATTVTLSHAIGVLYHFALELMGQEQKNG